MTLLVLFGLNIIPILARLLFVDFVLIPFQPASDFSLGSFLV